MQLKKFRTNLNCQNCVAKARPFLESTGVDWEVDVKDPGKILTVRGEVVDSEQIRAAVLKSGFKVFEEIAEQLPAPTFLNTYRPLILIFSFLVLAICMVEIQLGFWDLHRMMSHFMGGFFFIFSFFKFLDLGAFAMAYRSYDLLAKKFPFYGYLYPFLEFILGALYLSGTFLVFTNATTLLLMGVSSLGVIQSLLQKQKIQCACLGTVFQLPMSKVTLFEDLLMMLMAAFSLLY